MSQVVLRTIDLGKRYQIGGEREAYRTLRDTVAHAVARPIERIRHPGAATHRSESLWALRHVDIEIRDGEAVGIIGGNGAGKSTLLKVLSHITEPTEGRAELRGRVASLLEVGTGFHQELTGRENIQLNGAILGMTRREIKSKFDDIVEFSEIGRFLDTPVKRYSTGMFVRLAFAVAAHLEPELLIVDEVLAVGDAAFQKKCLGKMGDVAAQGRTVLFVSHNMAAVTSLCSRAVLLEHGRLVESGPTADITDAYLRRGKEASSTLLADRIDRSGSGSVRFTALTLEDAAGEPVTSACGGSPVTLRLDYSTVDGRSIRNTVVGILVRGSYGQPLFMCLSQVAQNDCSTLPPEGSVRCHIPVLGLLPGVYALDIWCNADGASLDHINHASELTVSEGDFFGSGKLPPREGGEFLVPHTWEVTERESTPDEGQGVALTTP
jgi:lipopolysaccharide transport system ATP-binding protein